MEVWFYPQNIQQILVLLLAQALKHNLLYWNFENIFDQYKIVVAKTFKNQ